MFALKRRLCRILILFGLFFWITAGSAVGSDRLLIITEIAPPATFMDEDGRLAGLAIDIVRAIQEEVCSKASIQVMPWARGYQELTSGADVALFPTTRTPAREDLFHWVGPLFTTRWIIYARKGSNLSISTLEDAKKIRRIGVYRDDARAQYLMDQGFDNLDITDRQELNVGKLLADRVDAIVYSDLTMKEYLSKTGTDPDMLEAVYEIGFRDVYIAFSKGADPDTVARWQAACDKLEESGELKRIRQKWLP